MWANLFNRSSYVQFIHIDSLTFSSIVQLGDSTCVQGFSRAMAIQREMELFYGNEGNFLVYPIFSEPIPFTPITENLSLQTNNRFSSSIKVNDLTIIGISSSSMLHVGNSDSVQMETRIKHIRQLSNRTEEENLLSNR